MLKRGALARQPIECKRCARDNAAGSRFCAACGAPLPDAGDASQRRPEAEVAATGDPAPRPMLPLTASVLAAGAVVLAALSFMGYRGSEMFSFVSVRLDKLHRPADSAGRVSAPARRGSFGLDAAAPDVATGTVGRGIASFVEPAPASRQVSGGPARCSEAISALGLCAQVIAKQE